MWIVTDGSVTISPRNFVGEGIIVTISPRNFIGEGIINHDIQSWKSRSWLGTITKIWWG